MTTGHHTETAFEEVIETHLLAHGYIPVDRTGFDRARVIFPETVLALSARLNPRSWPSRQYRMTAPPRTSL